MDLKSVINIILRDLKEAGDLIDDLKNKPKFPELQIELTRSKCRSAEELIKIIGDIITEAGIEDVMKPGISESIVNNEILEIQDKITEEEDEEKSKAEQPAEGKPDKEVIYSGGSEGSSEKKTENKSEQIIADRFAHLSSRINEKVGDSKKTEGSSEKKTENKSEQIIADRFAHLSSRINEKVGDSKKTEGKIRIIPVNDLNKAIGINDRFYFIRELFNGEEESYRQTIFSLNNASSKEEAIGILREAVKERADSEPALQLFELVERKLSAK